MSSVVIAGDTSGSVTLQAPAIAGSTTLTLPATSGNVLTSTSATVGSGGITFSDGSTQTAAASPYVLKNRIINGDMRIDQRNAGAAITPTASTYTLDRWQFSFSLASKFTIQQNAGSVTPPTGFTNYLGATVASAVGSLGASDYFQLMQKIEGFNAADLAWGSANAKTITISFWARSSQTGTFSVALVNQNFTRSYVSTYTISSANTWTYITATIAGDTTGTWTNTTNSTLLYLVFSLGYGSTYQTASPNTWLAGEYYQSSGSVTLVNTASATFYITGVQLEIGSTATPFERRLYNQELANCQRYYYRLSNTSTGNMYQASICGGYNTTRAFGSLTLPVSMRSLPTAGYSGARVGSPNLSTVDQAVTAFFNQLDASTNQNQLFYEVNVASGLTANTFYWIKLPVSGYLDASAEL